MTDRRRIGAGRFRREGTGLRTIAWVGSAGPADRAALETTDPGLRHWSLDPESARELARAESATRDVVLALMARRGAVSPTGHGPDSCDDATLARRLARPEAWSDVGVRPEVGDGVVALNGDRLDPEPEGPQIRRRRDDLERAIVAALVGRAPHPEGTVWRLSGHLWYRPGSSLGWHTNQRVPGWRAYLSWVPEPGRSFFRFRDPQGRVITSLDTGLDLRLFRVSADAPFWHCVGTEVDRHSLGYRLEARTAG